MNINNNLNKKNLIQSISSANPSVVSGQMEKIIETIFEEISTALICGDRVEIRGFGSFVVKKRIKSKVRNPKSGIIIEANDRGAVYFRASKELLKALNFKGVNDN